MLERVRRDLTRDFDPGHFRHADIEDGDIGLVVFDLLPRLQAVGRFRQKDDVGLYLQQRGQPLPQHGVIVGQENALTDQTTVLRIRRVAGALEDLTGQRFGFNPSILGDAKSATPEYRLSSLKQWYGYWADNYWSENWQVGVDHGEALLGETPDPNDRKNR